MAAWVSGAGTPPTGPGRPVTRAPCVSAGVGGGGPEPPPAEKPFSHDVPQAVCHAPGHARQPRLAPEAHPHPAAGRNRVQRETQQQLPVRPLRLLVGGAHALWRGQRRPPAGPACVPHCAQPGRGLGPAFPRQCRQSGGSGESEGRRRGEGRARGSKGPLQGESRRETQVLSHMGWRPGPGPERPSMPGPAAGRPGRRGILVGFRRGGAAAEGDGL